MKIAILLAITCLVLPGCVARRTAPETGAVVIRDFSFPWAPATAPRTECRLWIEGNRLKFSFDVDDDDVVVAADWQGESTVDQEDRVELFLARDAALERYYCLEIDPVGRVHDYAATHYRRFDTSWNCRGLETKGARTAAGYRVEGSVPLSALEAVLGRSVRSGSVLRVGLFRAEFRDREPRSRGERDDNWISWVRPEAGTPDFHIPSAFRDLRLP